MVCPAFSVTLLQNSFSDQKLKKSEPLIPVMKMISMMFNFTIQAFYHGHHLIMDISGSDNGMKINLVMNIFLTIFICETILTAEGHFNLRFTIYD